MEILVRKRTEWYVDKRNFHSLPIENVAVEYEVLKEGLFSRYLLVQFSKKKKSRQW